MKSILVSSKNVITTGDGTFKGWGTSLCWWANRVGHSKKLCDDAAELFFDKEKGLGMNIMRYNIGGGDDPTHEHIKRTDSMMPGYLTKDGVWQYDADKRQLDVLEACYRAAGKDAYVEAFSNSPPYFMTVSGCSSGNAIPFFNNLRRDKVDDFANYLAKVVDFLQKEKNIKVNALAPMNEPFTCYWKKNSPKQEGCHVNPGRSQSKLLLATKKAMNDFGLTDVDLTASDETNPIKASIAFSMLSKKAKAVVDRVSTHSYLIVAPQIGKKCRKAGKDLWMDESDRARVAGENAGEMSPSLWFAEKIIKDMNVLQPSAWVIWQIVAGYISKEGYRGRKDMSKMHDLNQGYWGVSVAEIDKEEYILTQKYYAFGQFTRFIRPGMKIVLVDDKTIAAIDEDDSSLVIVAVNDKAADEEVSFKLDVPFDFTMAEVTRTSGNTNGGEKWASLPSVNVSEKKLNATLKGNSVTTFVIK